MERCDGELAQPACAPLLRETLRSWQCNVATMLWHFSRKGTGSPRLCEMWTFLPVRRLRGTAGVLHNGRVDATHGSYLSHASLGRWHACSRGGGRQGTRVRSFQRGAHALAERYDSRRRRC